MSMRAYSEPTTLQIFTKRPGWLSTIVTTNGLMPIEQ
jgi:hypothetical protein